MKAFLCFLCLIFPTLIVESSNQERWSLIRTIQYLHELGPKECKDEVENATPLRFRNLVKKEIPEALRISYNSTFEILNIIYPLRITNCHWNNTKFVELMDHLYGQIKPYRALVVSSELETLVNDFKLLDNFLTEQKLNCCAWEIVRNDILVVMDHLRKRTSYRNRHS